MKFLIIVPHYGSNEHLVKLLPSLGYGDRVTDEMFEDTTIILPVHYGEIFIWNNNLHNLGFTAACNEGLRYGMNHGFDVFWLLNNDTEIINATETISSLEWEFTEHPETGVVGFKILSMDDPDFIHHGGTGACIPAGVHKIGRVSLSQLEKRSYEKWVTGASMAISAGCVLEIGLLDGRMFNYGSDSDFCYRARWAGFSVVYLPIPIKHKIGQSQNPSLEQIRVIKGDMLTFQCKWLNGKVFHELDNELLPN